MSLPFREEKTDWKIVLEHMYENRIAFDPDLEPGEKWIPLDRSNADMKYDAMQENLDFSKLEIDKAVSYLQSVGLVRKERHGEENLNVTYGLTQEGIQFAHNLKSERQRRWTNILLTGGILLVSILTLAVRFV